MEELKKLPDSEFCNAVAFAWACQLTGPKPFQNPERDPPSYDDEEDGTKESTVHAECSSSTEQDDKTKPSTSRKE